MALAALASHSNSDSNPLGGTLRTQAAVRSMKIIGLTGGIGSGKTTVARFLADMGAVVIDADTIGHEILDTDLKVQEELAEAFGKRVIRENGTVDRARLGRLVFSDPEVRARLNRLMHPLIYQRITTRIEDYRRRKVSILVLEVPLLVETKGISLVDEVWVTVASEATVLKRLSEKPGLSKAEALARIGSQLASDERIKRADEVINTDCSLEELKTKVGELWHRRQGKAHGENTKTASG